MGSKCDFWACEDMRDGAILNLIAKDFGVCLPIQDACTTALNGIDLPSLVIFKQGKRHNHETDATLWFEQRDSLKDHALPPASLGDQDEILFVIK
jgi:hypothetical protein